MGTKRFRHFVFLRLTGAAPLALGAGLCAAPLAWFPGPSVGTPFSAAATVVTYDRANVLIGGDGLAGYDYPLTYPESLTATNLYWNYLPPIYSLNIAPGAVASGGMIIFYGGTDGTNSTSATIGYSPSGDTPLTLPSMSVPRSYLGYEPDHSGNAYAIGGLDEHGQPLASAERFNPDSGAAGAWSAIAALPGARYSFPAVFDGTNQIYIFGGRTNTESGAEIATVLRYSVSKNTWTNMAPMPIATAGSAAALGVDGKIYVVGGLSGGVATDAVQVYNPAANSWTTAMPLPEALSACAMGVDSIGRLIVMGGMDADGNDVSDVWRSQQLNLPDSAPAFTQYPGTSYQIAYNSSITATGAPPPLYVLLSGPAGMQLDMYSGAITWTPQANQIGTNPVTVRATNYPGYADWNFAIIVTNPPPTNPTNLAVVGVTDNSVTLSWDPESPVVGPVTYSVYLRHVLHDPRGSGSTIWYTQLGSSTTQPMITLGGLTPGLAQVYYVAATGSGGTSGYGSGILATTTAPQGPTNLLVTDVTSTSVSLSWTPSSGPDQNPLFSPITSYTIMERIASPPSNIPTVTGITGTSGTVTGLVPGRSHIWFVSGVDAAGNASTIGVTYVVVTNPVVVPPLVSGAGWVPTGAFQFTVQERGNAVQTVLIQASTDLTDPAGWVQIGSILPTGSTFTFTDTNAAQYPARFYRALVR